MKTICENNLQLCYKETPTQVFSYEYFKNVKNAYLKNICERLLLSVFMNKTLKIPIMTRSMLKNKFNEKRAESNWTNYKKQINFCSILLARKKGNKLNITSLSDN